MQNAITVLTGDAEFDRTMKSTLSDILRGNYDKPICILQAPHHGACKEWEALGFTGDDFEICIIPFGYGNTYGHPSHRILTDLRAWNRQDKNIIWIEVTQFSGFAYRINLPKLVLTISKFFQGNR
jgi:beta-lactamase superfamily II metal-dependent hydrolase